MTAVAFGLVVSLGLNLALVQRADNERSEAEALRAQLAAQAEELDALRGRIRDPEGNSPLEQIASSVEKLRHLTFKNQVQAELVSAAALRDRVRALYNAGAERADINATANVLRAFGVLPENYNLYTELLALQEEQVAGFYDSDTKKMVAAAADARAPSPLSRTFLAHEYVHALTDQHFDLGRLDDLDEKNSDDAATAIQALFEGDASYVMDLYRAEVLTAEEQDAWVKELSGISQQRFESAPAFLQSALLFPYSAGLEFVQALHRSAGFDAVDAAYRDPPVSTEQILHPGKYLAPKRDDPQTIQMPDVRRAVGGGWTQVQVGEIGEFDVREILDLGGGTGIGRSDAGSAADGWDGGRYVALQDGNKFVVAAMTIWDSASEATDAFRALGRWLPLRFRNQGSSFDPAGPGIGWTSAEGSGLASRSGDRVLWIMGTSQDAVDRAASAFPGF